MPSCFFSDVGVLVLVLKLSSQVTKGSSDKRDTGSVIVLVLLWGKAYLINNYDNFTVDSRVCVRDPTMLRGINYCRFESMKRIFCCPQGHMCRSDNSVRHAKSSG